MVFPSTAIGSFNDIMSFQKDKDQFLFDYGCYLIEKFDLYGKSYIEENEESEIYRNEYDILVSLHNELIDERDEKIESRMRDYKLIRYIRFIPILGFIAYFALQPDYKDIQKEIHEINKYYNIAINRIDNLMDELYSVIDSHIRSNNIDYLHDSDGRFTCAHADTCGIKFGDSVYKCKGCKYYDHY